MTMIHPISTGPGSLPWSSRRGVTRVLENSRADLIGKIADLHAQEAVLAAQKAELIDQARQWSELTETAGSSTRIGGWDAATVARKHLATELAAALRMPERSIETLVAESETLVHELAQADPPSQAQSALGSRNRWRDCL